MKAKEGYDEWVKEGYDEWVEVNKNNIMEAYIDGLDFGDIPGVFIQDLFEKEMIKQIHPDFDNKLNTGDMNTGDMNTGDRNTGDWNTGNMNTGGWNTGDWNTGDWNTGDMNTGDMNTGDMNTGDWNTGDMNTGFLNTVTPNILIFNKETSIKKEDISFPDYFFFDLIKWVNFEVMTKKEKKDNPFSKRAGGYLNTFDFKVAWKTSFKNASKEDVRKTLELPNFDYEVFEELSGISKKMINSKVKGK